MMTTDELLKLPVDQTRDVDPTKGLSLGFSAHVPEGTPYALDAEGILWVTVTVDGELKRYRP